MSGRGWDPIEGSVDEGPKPRQWTALLRDAVARSDAAAANVTRPPAPLINQLTALNPFAVSPADRRGADDGHFSLRQVVSHGNDHHRVLSGPPFRW
jgi:hypothetical protein